MFAVCRNSYRYLTYIERGGNNRTVLVEVKHFICQMSMTIGIDPDCPSNKRKGCFHMLAWWIMGKLSRCCNIRHNRHVRCCMGCLYEHTYLRRSYGRFVEDDDVLSSDREESPRQSACIILPEISLHTDIDCRTSICKDYEDTESYLTLSPITSDITHEFNVGNIPDAPKFTGESDVFTDSGSLSSSLTEVTSVSTSLSDDFESWCEAAKRSIPHNHNNWFEKLETSFSVKSGISSLVRYTRVSREEEET
ncbi:hypothetical protein HOLleu_18612 [Holothuria leucospilota]|uniref:Uncharacterized protein n=1 Tax=Holothuria leucospilota TaxID=206669 RepID=A0A9Q1C327_HOLLE|nr:hypothetical protein HOLleu_18612 [Holothuria leucospilota]